MRAGVGEGALRVELDFPQVWASAAATVSVFEGRKPLNWALRGMKGMGY